MQPREGNRNTYYVAGGTLSAQAGSYIARSADDALFESIREGKFCYVLNSRQMGKSSLCVRTMQRLEAAGIQPAFVDLTKIGGGNVSSEQWYAGIAIEIGRSLGLRTEFLAYWKEHTILSPVQRLFGSIREVALEKLSLPVAIFFDEIDATRSLSFSADEFFAAIRECYNRRVQDAAFERLSFCLLGVAVPSDLINSPTSTPFNVGERIELQDFTVEEALALAKGLEVPGRDAQAILRRIHYWTGGQPYLTQSLCAAVVGDPALVDANGVDSLVRRELLDPQARETNINLADVANRAVHAGDLEPDPEKFRADLLSLYEKIWRGKNVADDESNRAATLLKLSGIVRTDRSRLRIRNQIYRQVFDQAWVLDNMPGQELVRQRKSFWMGALRASLVGAAVVAVIAWFAVQAFQAKQAAVEAQKKLDYELYVAKMNTMELFEKDRNIVEMSEVLEETKNSPYRGWEWGYWNGVVHDTDEEYVIDSPNRQKPPTAMFSRDCTQILIKDDFLKTAFLIDRKTRTVVGRYPVEPNEQVMDTSRGWIVFGQNGVVAVQDLKTRQTLYTFSGPGKFGGTVVPDPDAGAILAYRDSLNPPGSRAEARDAVTGKVLWQSQLQNEFRIPLFLSKDRSKIMVVTTGSTMATQAFIAIDVRNGAELWRSSSSRELMAIPSPSFRYIAVSTPAKLSVYDLSRRRTLFEQPVDEKNQSVSYFGQREDVLFSLNTVGNTVVRQLPSGTILSKINGYPIGFGANDEALVASSSVKVLPRPVQGLKMYGRVTRDEMDRLVLDDNSDKLVYLSDPDLQKVGQVRQNLEDQWFGRLHRRYLSAGRGEGYTEIVDEVTGNVLLRTKGRIVDVGAASAKGNTAVMWNNGAKLSGYRIDPPRKAWERNVGECQGAAVSADGKRMIVTGKDSVLLLEGETGKTVKEYSDGHDIVTGGSGFLRGGRDFFMVLSSEFRIYDGGSLRLKFRHSGPSQLVNSIDISPDGSRVLVTLGTGATVYDVATGKRVFHYPAYGSTIDRGLFTADGKKIVVSSYGGSVEARVLETDPRDRVTRIPVK